MPRRTSHEVTFVWDPLFDTNLLHWRGTLNGVSQVFVVAAQKYATKLRTLVGREIATYSALAAVNEDYGSTTNAAGLYKAMLYSLKTYQSLVYISLERGALHNTAIVASGHAASDRIEFGGVDSVLNVNGEYLEYPAFRFLSRVII